MKAGRDYSRHGKSNTSPRKAIGRADGNVHAQSAGACDSWGCFVWKIGCGYSALVATQAAGRGDSSLLGSRAGKASLYLLVAARCSLVAARCSLRAACCVLRAPSSLLNSNIRPGLRLAPCDLSLPDCCCLSLRMPFALYASQVGIGILYTRCKAVSDDRQQGHKYGRLSRDEDRP